MFEIHQLYDSATKALCAIAKQERLGTSDSREIESALAELSKTWDSPECKRYREAFARVAIVAEQARGLEGQNLELQTYFDLLNYETLIDGISRTQQFNDPRLLNYLAGFQTMADLIIKNKRTIDASFAKSV